MIHKKKQIRVYACIHMRIQPSFFWFFFRKKARIGGINPGRGPIGQEWQGGGFPISAASTFVIFYCHSVQMKSFFKDFDRVTKGLYQTTLITRTRFERVLTLVGVQRKLAS